MALRAVAGIFDTLPAAEAARRQLLASGVDGGRISLTSNRPDDDGIAAEAPGQSFENQPGQDADDGWLELFTGDAQDEPPPARFGEAVGSGAVVSVAARSREEQKDIARVLHRHGARRIREDLD